MTKIIHIGYTPPQKVLNAVLDKATDIDQLMVITKRRSGDIESYSTTSKKEIMALFCMEATRIAIAAVEGEVGDVHA